MTRTGSLLAVTALLAAALYTGSLTAGFVFDDHQLVEQNPLVTEPGHLREIASEHYWHPIRPRGYLYRPLTILSLRLNHSMGGGPAPFHATNILLHAAASALVLLALSLALPGRSSTVPLLAGLLFAAHPIHSEAVAGIAGRADLLATIGVLAAWCLHMRGHHGLSAAAFLAGVLSKESAIVLPVLLVLSDRLLGPRPRGTAAILRRYAPAAAATVIYLLARWVILGRLGTDASLITYLDNPLAHETAWVRIATALRVLALQARTLLLPWTLSADYSFSRIPPVDGPLDPGTLAGIVILAAGLAASWMWRARPQGPAFPVLFTLVSLLPVSNLVVPVGTIMAERTLYLPSVGFCAGLASALAALARGGTAVALGLGLAATALLGARTVLRVPVWADDRILFASAVEAAPDSAKARYNLGMVLLRSGDAQGALPHLQRAVEITRGAHGTVSMMSDLGIALTRMGRHSEAIETLRGARAIDPDDKALALNLGNAYSEAGDTTRALMAYDEALALDPGYHGARLNRARLLLRSGRRDEAVRELERVALESTGPEGLREEALDLLESLGR